MRNGRSLQTEKRRAKIIDFSDYAQFMIQFTGIHFYLRRSNVRVNKFEVWPEVKGKEDEIKLLKNNLHPKFQSVVIVSQDDRGGII